MKISYLFLFTICTGSAYAQPMPSLYDSAPYQPGVATYSVNSTPVAVPVVPVTTNNYAPSNQELALRVNNLQNDVAQLKTTVNAQSKALTALQQNQNTINARLGAGGTAVIPTAPTSMYSNLVLPTASNNPHNSASQDEKARYNNAYATFQYHNYDQAIAQFRDQLTAYPNGSYADNALYWIGEAYLRKGDKTTAMQTFDQIVRSYPQGGGKVPDALLKLGIIQAGLKNTSKAKEYLDYVITHYPNSEYLAKAMATKTKYGIY